MKGLNVRVLAVLVGVGLAVAVGAVVVRHFQVHRHAGIYRDKAQELNKSEDLLQRAEAVQHYNRYLGLRPDDIDTRIELGYLYADLAEENRANRGRAFLCLEKVLREDSLKDDVRRKVIDLAMEMRRYADARAHLDILQNRAPDDGRLTELRAQCQLAEQDYVAAKQSYEKAISLTPDLLDAYVGLANLLRAHGKEIANREAISEPRTAEDEGEESGAGGDAASEDDSKKEDDEAKDKADEKSEADLWMDKMVDRNPDNAEAYLMRGQYLARMGKLEQAQADVTKAIELAPDNKDILLLAIQVAADRKDYDQGRKYAEHAVKLFPDAPEVYRTASMLEGRAGNSEQARQWIDKGLVATEEDPTLIWEKVNLLISDKDLSGVRPLIKRLRDTPSRLSHPMFIGYLEARLAFAEREWHKASQIFEEIGGDLARFSPSMAHRANLDLLECYKKLNQRERARRLENTLRARTIARPTTTDERWRQLAAAGHYPRAIVLCRNQLKRGDAPPERWLDLARLLIVNNARLAPEERDWSEVELCLRKSQELLPDNPQVALLQAQVLDAQGRVGDAIRVLETAVKHDPTNWASWDRLLIMAQRDKDWARAEELLAEADRHIEAKTSIYLAQARLAVARDGEEAAEALKELGKKAESMADSEKLLFWRMLAGFCLRIKAFEQAKEYCQLAADQDPANMQIRILLAEIARRLQDEPAMRRAVEELGTIENKGPVWEFYSAQLLIMFDKSEDKTKVYKTAIEHLNQARMGRPEWADVPMLMAKIQEQMGDKESAIENYRKAIELGSLDAIGLGRAAQLLSEQGQHDEASQILVMLKQTKAKLPTSVLLAEALGLLADGDLAGARARFEHVANELRKKTEGSDHFEDHRALSRIVRTLAKVAAQQGQKTDSDNYFDEAEQALRQATTLAPEHRGLWIDLVVLMAESGRSREVSNVIDEARQKLPPDQVALTLAQCYEVLKRGAEAEMEYEKAYEQNKEDKELSRLMARFYLRSRDKQQKAKGEVILREMIDGKRAVNESDIPWARRQLAVLLSERGEHGTYHQAMDLVEANLKADPGSVLDKRLKARLLARRPSRTERKKAQALFEELVQLPKVSPHDRYELARLYFAEELWNKASQQMQPLLARKQVRPEWLNFYIRAQIRAREFAGAEAKLSRYETMVTDPFQAAVMRARIYSGRGRHDRAIRILRDYVDKTSSTMATRPTRARRTAQALENLAKHVTGPGRDAAVELYLSQAEEYLREYVGRAPKDTKLLVGFLGRQGKREDALEIAEGADEKASTGSLAVSAIALLSRGTPTPDEIQRAEKILNTAIAQNKDNAEKYESQIKQLGSDDSAKKARLERAIRGNKAEKKALLLSLAELLSIQKRYDQAEKTYREVLADDPKDIFALNNLAVFLSLRGLKLDDALEMINKAIEQAGPVATLLDSRATVYLAEGKYQDALDDLSMALAEEPTGIRLFHQAQAYAQADKKREARASLQRADSYGLKVEHLQPLERPAYRQLREQLQ